MENTRPVTLSRVNSPEIIFGHHEILGEYQYSVRYKQWMCVRELLSGDCFPVVSKNHKAPTDEEALLWQGIDARIFQFIEMAMATIVVPGPKEWSGSLVYSDLYLSSIELTAEDSFNMVFSDDVLCEENCLWPVVRFENWKIVDSLWEP